MPIRAEAVGLVVDRLLVEHAGDLALDAGTLFRALIGVEQMQFERHAIAELPRLGQRRDQTRALERDHRLVWPDIDQMLRQREPLIPRVDQR